MRRNPPRQHTAPESRARIAAEAARVLAESGLRDYAFAKRKAAQRLGLAADAALPGNGEIDAALRAHQRLFQSGEQPQTLRRLRQTALDAMRFLREFSPRLAGAVLDGSADEHCAIDLHLFSDDPDAPARQLADAGIAYRAKTRKLRFDERHHHHEEFPALRFDADGASIELTVFAPDGERRAPLDAVTGKPMRRATREALEKTLRPDA